MLTILGLIYFSVTGVGGSSLLQFRFNPFALLSGATVLINASLLIYFVRKPARTDERIWLAVYLIGLVIYATGEMFWRLSATQTGAVFWTNISDAGAIIPAALYLFVVAYTNRSERRYPGLTALVLLATLVYLHLVGSTNLVYNNNPASYVPRAWGFDAVQTANTGSAEIIALLWFFGLALLSWLQLVNFRRHTRNAILRKQSLIFIIATAIPFVCGTFTDLILPDLGVAIPAFGITLFTPAALLIIYGLKRYQLLTVSPTLFSNTILGIMQESVVVADDDLNVVYMNPQAETMLGVSVSDTRAVSLPSKLAPKDGPVLERTLADHAAQGGKAVDIDHMNIARQGGDSLPVHIIATRLQLPDISMWVIALSDITKELQTRGVIEHEVDVRTAQLHRARAYLISSINSLEQGFILVRPDMKIELINGTAATLFKQEGESTDQDLAAVIAHRAWNVNVPEAVKKVLASHRHHRLDAAATDGSFYQIFITPVMTKETLLGCTIVIEDVTEQRILDRSKDEFFSIASHELRTPLTAIRGNMSMAKNYFPEVMKDKKFAPLITDTHDASMRLIEIVNDFLDSSSLEQGKMKFDLRAVQIAPIAEAASTDLHSLLHKHKNTIELQHLDHLPKVMVDEDRLRQILYNLLSNAIKYGQRGIITISAEVRGPHLLLRVSDQGPGISPEGQKLLFHKFQQTGDMLARPDTKGTGLGLYISRLLALRMHGNVELERSEVGKGSTFVVTLPLATSK